MEINQEKCENNCPYLDCQYEMCWEYGVNLKVNFSSYYKCDACKSKTEQNTSE